MRIGYLLLAIVLLAPSINSNALVADDQVGVCYKFEGNKVVHKDVCLISIASAQDDTYIDLKTSQNFYELKSHYGTKSYKLDGRPAKFYYRTPTHYNVHYGSWENRHLTCYKSKIEEICYLDKPIQY